MSTTSPTALQTLQDRVRERIQSTFMDMIPPDVFNEMVDRCAADFFKNELPKLAREVLTDTYREQLLSEFKKPGWADKYTAIGYGPSDLVASIVKNSAPELVAQLFGGIVQGAVNNLRNNRMY